MPIFSVLCVLSLTYTHTVSKIIVIIITYKKKTRENEIPNERFEKILFSQFDAASGKHTRQILREFEKKKHTSHSL